MHQTNHVVQKLSVVPDPSGSSSNTFQTYLNIRQAARILGVAVGTLYHWVSRAPRAGDPIPFIKLSARCLRFPDRDLEDWAARRGTTLKSKTLRADRIWGVPHGR